MDERRQCPECRTDVEADDSACPFCDAVLKKKVPLLSAASRGWGQRPALKPCPDCGAEVSTRAEACPHCGCPSGGGRRPTRLTGRPLVRAMIGAFAVIVFLNVAMAGRRGAKAPLSS